ncbi:ankyrin repeat and MYND domain-containing protein 2-like isoform X2 [Paramormyrops kingsleyae]|uniref:ankyrin repeat and MYND domain-containing protein 2-like isoform X2 n=1 Tax=Paramormyrops kingsleyae TaxID=1676925 RepID=UPI000CD5FB2C|nr:ankyrin repeat and MYND domain-containing protein 2-like isoform X2 [Paramormyrops kingsleyae]
MKMVMLIKENLLLVDLGALEKFCGVMDLICEQCVKQPDMTEVLTMKMRYINWVLQKYKGNLDILVKALTEGMTAASSLEDLCMSSSDVQEEYLVTCVSINHQSSHDANLLPAAPSPPHHVTVAP